MMNQSVLFTKPLHHLGIDLSADELADRARRFFTSRGFSFRIERRVSGESLAQNDIIREHYRIYSKASYGAVELNVHSSGLFAQTFESQWGDERAAGRILSNPALMERFEINADQLFTLWNAAEVKKIQPGLLMAWLDDLKCYCMNAFYPAMEANFYHPDNQMVYFVVDFDPARISWAQFRDSLLGATRADRAAPESFRGQLYADYPVNYPGRDNFVHGSAGPFEGFIERTVHEAADFMMNENPVGQWLEKKGRSLPDFCRWLQTRSLAELSDLFDATEQMDTPDVFTRLAEVDWSVG